MRRLVQHAVMHLKALRSEALPPAGRRMCSPMGCVVCDARRLRLALCLLLGSGGLPPGCPFLLWGTRGMANGGMWGAVMAMVG